MVLFNMSTLSDWEIDGRRCLLNVNFSDLCFLLFGMVVYPIVFRNLCTSWNDVTVHTPKNFQVLVPVNVGLFDANSWLDWGTHVDLLETVVLF